MFITGSSVVWGAEMSLLTLAERVGETEPVALITSNERLAAEWASRVNDSVSVVAAPSGRITRLIGFLMPMINRVPAGSTLMLFDFYLLPLVFLLTPVLRIRRVAVLADLHDSSRFNRSRRPYFWLTRATRGVICVSQYIASQIPASVPRAVVYRPLGARDVDERRDVTNSGDAHAFGAIGQVIPSKRIDYAIEVLRRVKAPVSLAVRGAPPAGGDSELARITSLGAEALGDRFHYEGRVSNQAVMANLDGLLALNIDEPFGRIVVEAQLSGVVPFVSAAGGFAELVEDAVTGVHLDPDDPRRAAQQVDSWLNNRDRLRDLAESARLYATDRYAPDRICSEYRTAILELERTSPSR